MHHQKKFPWTIVVLVIATTMIVILVAEIPTMMKQWEKASELRKLEQEKIIARQKLLEQQITNTQKLVNDTALLFDKDEKFVEKFETTPKDAWGTELTIVIEGGAFQLCTVKSSGPDKKLDSPDDLIATNRNISAQSVGKSAGKVGTDFGIGLVKGAYNAVKEEFTSSKPEEESSKK